MAIPYMEAIDILQRSAQRKAPDLAKDGETLPILSAAGRLCAHAFYSTKSTPAFDTSAMDGYAVNSASTANASPSKPLTFCVKGTIAAGDVPLRVSASIVSDPLPCVEIMTGARFPMHADDSTYFDACIKFEDTIAAQLPGSPQTYIQVTKPALPNQNRRLAGTDFGEKDLIIPTGIIIQPHHIMALATLGVGEVAVHRKLHVGIISTGSELVSPEDARDCGSSTVRDCNGPYIEAFLSRLGVEVTNLGIVKDDSKRFEELIMRSMRDDHYDLIIATGAVSMGKFDFVRDAIENVGGNIGFHRVAIRPGHPVLFANLPKLPVDFCGGGAMTPPVSSATESGGSDPSIGFFGLPGNPIAAAVCLRFLVVPYLRSLHALKPLEEGVPAVLKSSPIEQPGPPNMVEACSIPFTKPPHLQAFWHGKRSNNREVTIARDQGSSKIKPLLAADCWVGVSPGRPGVGTGDVVSTFDMYPTAI